MVPILGLIVGAIIELAVGLSLTTYAYLAVGSIAAIILGWILMIIASAKWGDDGIVLGSIVAVLISVVFGNVLTIAIGGAITKLVLGAV
jgi:hypothetical protein